MQIEAKGLLQFFGSAHRLKKVLEFSFLGSAATAGILVVDI
jgi:hypothetical protein